MFHPEEVSSMVLTNLGNNATSEFDGTDLPLVVSKARFEEWNMECFRNSKSPWRGAFVTAASTSVMCMMSFTFVVPFEFPSCRR